MIGLVFHPLVKVFQALQVLHNGRLVQFDVVCSYGEHATLWTVFAGVLDFCFIVKLKCS